MVLIQRYRAGFLLVAGIVAYFVGQDVTRPEGVGFEEIVVFAQVVVAPVAEIRSAPDALLFEILFYKVITFGDAHVGKVLEEFLFEFPLGHLKDQGIYDIALPGLDEISHVDFASGGIYPGSHR